MKNNLIYHYCDLNAFIEIIRSKKLWMSDLNKMNDVNELKTGLVIAIKLFEDIFPERKGWFDNFIIDDLIILNSSFSYKKDALSQWRAYGQDGEGACIGIDITILDKVNSHDTFKGLNVPASHSIDEVYYNKTKFKDFVRNWLNEFKNKNGTPSLSSQAKPYKRIEGVAYSLIRFACLFKESFYSQEKEVRYIDIINKISLLNSKRFKSETDFDFRLTKYGLTAYSKLWLEKKELNSIKEIILGPKNNWNEKDIVLFLQMNNMAGVYLNKSAGNYR